MTKRRHLKRVRTQEPKPPKKIKRELRLRGLEENKDNTVRVGARARSEDLHVSSHLIADSNLGALYQVSPLCFVAKRVTDSGDFEPRTLRCGLVEAVREWQRWLGECGKPMRFRYIPMVLTQLKVKRTDLNVLHIERDEDSGVFCGRLTTESCDEEVEPTESGAELGTDEAEPETEAKAEEPEVGEAEAEAEEAGANEAEPETEETEPEVNETDLGADEADLATDEVELSAEEERDLDCFAPDASEEPEICVSRPASDEVLEEVDPCEVQTPEEPVEEVRAEQSDKLTQASERANKQTSEQSSEPEINKPESNKPNQEKEATPKMESKNGTCYALLVTNEGKSAPVAVFPSESEALDLKEILESLAVVGVTSPNAEYELFETLFRGCRTEAKSGSCSEYSEESDSEASDTDNAERLAELEDMIKLYESENDDLEQQVSNLTDRCRSLEKESQLQGTKGSKDVSETRNLFRALPSSPYEALSLAAKAWPDRLVVLDSAYKSAKDWDGKTDEAWEVLTSIATELWKLSFEEAPADFCEEFKNRTGFELSLREGKETRRRPDLMRLRTATYRGQEVVAAAHVKGHGRKKGIRVHYHIDTERRLIVIVHCGCHLKTAGSKRAGY